MHRKGLYKIAVRWNGPTPSELKSPPPEPAKFMYKLPPELPPKLPLKLPRPPGTVPDIGRLLETKAIVFSPPEDRGYRDPFDFILHNRQGTPIPVNTMTDTPYFFNTVGWKPPTDRPFNYSELYNAQVDDPQGWAKYQAYRRTIPLEDINKVTKVPANNAERRGTDRYSSADDFVNTVGQGPLFRWYNTTSEDAQPDHVAIYASPQSYIGAYGMGLRKMPYGFISLQTGNLKNYNALVPTELSGRGNGLVDADSGSYLEYPPMVIASHEMAHALTHAYSAPGTDYRRPKTRESWYYSYNPVEQVQAAHTLNKSYQALLNSLAKGNHKDMPSEFREIIDTYPAYGSKEQYMARNDALLAYPELAVKYLGVEPSRALAQLKQLKYNAWLQRNGWFRTGRRVRDAQKHLDFFNDNYFADASFNGNAAQRHA